MTKMKPHDTIDLFERAHAPVLKVAPRADDRVVLIVARELATNGNIDRSTVKQIVVDRDPVASRIARALGGYGWSIKTERT